MNKSRPRGKFFSRIAKRVDDKEATKAQVFEAGIAARTIDLLAALALSDVAEMDQKVGLFLLLQTAKDAADMESQEVLNIAEYNIEHADWLLSANQMSQEDYDYWSGEAGQIHLTHVKKRRKILLEAAKFIKEFLPELEEVTGGKLSLKGEGWGPK